MNNKIIEAVAKWIADNTNADGDFNELSFRCFAGGDERKIAAEILKVIDKIKKS